MVLIGIDPYPNLFMMSQGEHTRLMIEGGWCLLFFFFNAHDLLAMEQRETTWNNMKQHVIFA